MEGRTFTVEEVASMLNCSDRTVQRMVANGWLQERVGRPGSRANFLISEKSLFQFIFFKHISRFPSRALRELKHCRKKIARLSRQTTNANRYIDDGIPESETQTSCWHSQELQATEPRDSSTAKKRCLHHDFAEQHQKIFRRRARQLVPGDPALQDDLVQEMSLAVLEYNKSAKFELLYAIASNRAVDYLRYEAARGELSLSQAQEPGDKRTEQTARLNASIENLIQSGVRKEWIEEVLGYRLEAA